MTLSPTFDIHKERSVCHYILQLFRWFAGLGVRLDGIHQIAVLYR